MKLRNLINNALSSYKKNFFWSVLLSLLFSFLFLLVSNLYLLVSQMNVFYETVYLLDSYNTSRIEFEDISQVVSPPERADFSLTVMDEYQTNLVEELLRNKQAGHIKQYTNEFFQLFFTPSDLKKLRDINNVVLISGKYLDFADINEDFSNNEVYAYASEDMAHLTGTEFEFSNESIPIIDTINYSYPIDITHYATVIINDDYQEDFQDYNNKTIFIATNSLEKVNDLKPFGESLISDFDIFNPTEQLLYDFNSHYSSNASGIGFYLNVVDHTTRFDETNPLKLKIDSIVIGSGALLVFIILLISLFQNIKDQHKEFSIHMQFGADYPFIFYWILLYVFVYLLPSLVLIPVLLFFTLPVLLTAGNIIKGIILYMVFILLLSVLAFGRFKKQNRF